MRRSKWTGPLAAVFLLMLAFGPSAASAAEFHASGGAGKKLTGTQTGSHVFTISGSKVTCSVAKLTGSTPAATWETLSLHPEYATCTAFGFVGATVDTTGCQYVFNANSTSFNLTSCTNGGVTITASSAFGKCMVHIKNQNGINGISLQTETTSPNRDVRITANSNNIHVEVTTATGICPLTAPDTLTAEDYAGVFTLQVDSGEIFVA